VDIVPQRADAYKERYGARKAYYSVSDALRDPEIEGVALCLAHYLHYPVSIECMQAGKHVLVEKVMSNSYENSLDMVAEAQKNGVTLMVGQSRRYFHAVRESVRLAHSGEIGRIYNTIATWQMGMDAPATGWWKDRSKAGGLLMMLDGSHVTDYITWLRNYELPKTVYCRLDHLNPLWEGEDEITMVFGYADNASATIHISFNVMGYRIHHRIIQGTQGYMILDNECELLLNGEKIVDEKIDFESSFAAQVREFVLSIREGREPLSSGRLVAPVNAILEAAFLSARTGNVVSLKDVHPDLADL
jgi:predicted dehydrogenase